MGSMIYRVLFVQDRPALPKLAVILAAIFISAFFARGSVADPVVNKTADDVAINGYDTVAYFEDGKATRGSTEHEALWQDARWLFASDKHRRIFEAEPTKYAPQFGGLCAASVAKGRFVQVDAETWAIVDGKLYLNYDRETAER
jgi:hypothetical protein